MSSNEAALWERWTAGADPSAFAALVRPHEGFARAWAGRLSACTADADDAVQSALVRLAGAAGSRHVAVGIRAWLGREILQQARMLGRARRRRRCHERRAAQPGHTPRPGSGGLEVRDEVECCLARLEPEDRWLIELRYMFDMDYAEVAEVVGIRPGACRVRVHRALARLRAQLGPRPAVLIATISSAREAPASPWRDAQVARLLLDAPRFAAPSVAATPGGTAMAISSKATAIAIAAAVLGFICGAVAHPTWESPDPRTGSPASAPEPPIPPTLAGAAPVDSEARALRARIQELEAELAEARASPPPVEAWAAVVYGMGDLRSKIRGLLALQDPDARIKARGRLAQWLQENPSGADDVLRLLEAERDEGVLHELGRLVELSAIPRLDQEQRGAFRRVASAPEGGRRLVAFLALLREQLSADRPPPSPDELRQTSAALERESDPAVLGPSLRALGGRAIAVSRTWLEDLSRDGPPGSVRAHAIAALSCRGDVTVEDLLRAHAASSLDDARRDWAEAVSRRLAGARSVGERAANPQEAAAALVTLYQVHASAEMRAALRGPAVGYLGGGDAALAFLRGSLAAEVEPAVRSQILAAIERVAQGR